MENEIYYGNNMLEENNIWSLASLLYTIYIYIYIYMSKPVGGISVTRFACN